VRSGISVEAAIVMFGLFVSGTMVLVLIRFRLNQARGDALHLIGTEKPVHSPAGAAVRPVVK
jgi:hypothetical protein